jgi:peptidoglycan hydrolase-like protein with peptidoglycan-binding domain
MKFSPTITLALALAAGMAGAAAAQTAATPNAMPAQPQAAYGQAQQPAAQAQPSMQTGSTSPQQGFTAEHVQYAQQQLKAMGLYQGAIDGRMGPDTAAALANFQQQHGLRQTSTLDQQTYAQLTAGQTQGSGSATAPDASAPAGAGGITGGQTR